MSKLPDKDWSEHEIRNHADQVCKANHADQKGGITMDKPVTVDQECWIRDSLYTLTRMILSIREHHLKVADDDMYYSAIHGAVNGCAIEIIRHTGLENIYANLTEVKRILL